MEKIEALPELSGCTYDIENIRRGNKNKTVEEILFDNKEGDLLYPIETIHGCKGMSPDAVFSYLHIRQVMMTIQVDIGNSGLTEKILGKKIG